MKRKTSFLLALLCVLSAVSCGSATNDGAVTTAGSTGDTTTAAETDPPTMAGRRPRRKEILDPQLVDDVGLLHNARP